jgi:hypothetical protein
VTFVIIKFIINDLKYSPSVVRDLRVAIFEVVPQVFKINVFLDDVSATNNKFWSGSLDGCALNIGTLGFYESFTRRSGGNTSEDININI